MNQLQSKSDAKLEDTLHSNGNSLDKAAYTAFFSSSILGAAFALWMCIWLIFDLNWEGSQRTEVIFQASTLAVVIIAFGVTDFIFRRRRNDAFHKQPWSVRLPVVLVLFCGLICARIVAGALTADGIFRNQALPLACGIVVLTGYIGFWTEFFLRRRNSRRDSAENWSPKA